MKLFLRSAQFILISSFFEPLLKLYLFFALTSSKALKLYRETMISISRHEKKRIWSTGDKTKRLS